MKKIYTLLMVGLLGYAPTQAQFSYTIANARITTSTYTDLGTSGVAIATNSSTSTPTFDDGNSTAQNIGFTFNYNGNAFTQFVLNTNGFIKLGAVGTTAFGIYTANSTANTEANLLYALNLDLDGSSAAGTEYRVATTGTAPNRICTIQFKNVYEYNSGANQFAAMNFQIRLYETSNQIDFVYGTFTAGTGTDGAIFAHVGIKGSSDANTVNFFKASSQAWTAAATITGSYTGNAHNIRRTALPISGHTLRFQSAAIANNNLAIAAIHNSGKVALNNRDTIRVAVTNLGAQTQTNKTVSLAITGAAPFTGSGTISSIAPGVTQIVTLGVWQPTVAGTNSLTISLPPDDSTSNDTRTVTVTSALNQHGMYMGGAIASLGFNGVTAEFVQRISVAAPVQVNQLAIAFANTVAVGYRAVIYTADANGAPSTTPLWTSNDLTTPTTTTFVAIPVSPAVSIPAGNFFIGIQQTTTTSSGIAGEVENPVRVGNVFAKQGTGAWVDFSPVNNFRLVVEAQFSAALPVTLTKFTGERKGTINQLSWTTSTEINNAGFEIQKSADGIGFSKVAYIASKAVNGNSSVTNNYSLDDAQPFAGTNYYRLKQIDRDGKIAYSATVTISGTKVANITINNIFPNPAVNVVNIAIAAPKNGSVSLTVIDLAGKTITATTKSIMQGDNNLQIDVAALPAGTYLLKATDSQNGVTTTKQFVKQ